MTIHEALRELANALDDESHELRDKRPQSDRWIGRAVAYGASASRIRTILDAHPEPQPEPDAVCATCAVSGGDPHACESPGYCDHGCDKPEPDTGDMEGLRRAIAAAINYQSFDARAGQSDLSMAEEIVHVTNSASAPGGVLGWLAAHDAKVRREAKAEALREAVEDVAYEVRRFEVGCEADAGYYDAHMEISKMFRDRAARAEGE